MKYLNNKRFYEDWWPIAFGELLCYISPIDEHETKCVYLREENGRAVVMFENAEKVARVEFADLARQ